MGESIRTARPIGTSLIVKELPQESKLASGFILTEQNSDQLFGEILAKGKEVSSDLAVGSKVVFKEYFMKSGEDLIIDESHVLGVVEF